MAKSTTNNFYVYEHWRPDTAVSFYVGKGKAQRVRAKKRNFLHDLVVEKLKRNGLEFEIKIVRGGLTEDEAFALERERIAYWRDRGVRLCNLTDGGDGSTTTFTPDVIQRLRDARARQIITPEHIAKHRAAMASPEVRAKLSESAKARGSSIANLGERHSDKWRRAMSEKMKGRTLSQEHKAKISASVKSNNGFRGKRHSEETKQKIREARKRQIHWRHLHAQKRSSSATHPS